MTQPPQALDDPRDAAAYWFARMHSGNCGAAEQAAFRQWQGADARHAQEYQALEALWQASARIPQDEWRAMLHAAQAQDAAAQAPAAVPAQAAAHAARDAWAFAPPRGPGQAASPLTPAAVPAPRTPRRWRTGLASAACSLVLAVGLGATLAYLNTPAFMADYATAVGQQRSATLPDGSTVLLNTASHVIVRYYPLRRSVELRQGEALFDVQAVPRQAFIVDAGAASVHVTGTRFAVRLHGKGESGAEGVSVAVQSGSVAVHAGPWWQRWGRAVTALAANQHVQVGQGEVAPAQSGDVDALTAWRDGKLIFSGQPLAQVVQEMNRYLRQPIRLADARLAQQRVSGIFDVHSADDFLAALRHTLPVTVQQHPDGGVELRQR